MSEDRIYPSLVIQRQSEAIELLERENEQLKSQLKQRDEVIDEAIMYLENYYIGNLKYDKESQIAFRKLLSILYKYKGDSNE